ARDGTTGAAQRPRPRGPDPGRRPAGRAPATPRVAAAPGGRRPRPRPAAGAVLPAFARPGEVGRDRAASGRNPRTRALMLRIRGRVTSINVQKVLWCADELGLDYERIDVGGKFGGNDTAQYLAMNPNGLIPVIDDAGFVLYESNPILRYLAGREQGTALWPASLRERADIDRWMEWQSTNFSPAMWGAFWMLVRTPAERRDAALVESSRAKSEKFAGILDAHLASRRYLAG